MNGSETESSGTALPSNRGMMTNKEETRKRRSAEVKAKSKKSKKRERQIVADLEEEQRLTALLFGDGVDGAVAASAAEEAADSRNVSRPNDEYEKNGLEGDNGSLFQIDRVGGSVDLQHRDKEADGRDGAVATVAGSENPTPGAATNTAEKAVWQDEDDEDITINLLETSRLRKLRKSRSEATGLKVSELESRLRLRYQSATQISARTDWAQIAEEAPQVEKDETELPEQDEVDFFHSAEPMLVGTQSRLPPNILNTMRCPDANQSDPNQAVLQAVHFHPGSDPDHPLLLTAGFDKTLRFFQVGTEKSDKIHGIHFPKLPIYSASFLGTTGNVVVSGRRPFFYIYNAVAGKLDHVPRIIGREEKSLERCVASPDGRTLAFCGNDGYIILFDAHNKHWIADLKMNGSVRAITFTPDGGQVIASGSDGDVYRWDVQSRKCIERFSNEDGTITSALAASTRHLAVGAESGVVNLYSERTSRSIGPAALATSMFQSRSPIRSIMNLHTSADRVHFNHDGQLMAMSSRREKMAMKLLHVPTATVFSNWPTSKTPLNYVWSMDFSPKSRYLAVGNDQGRCLLYRLNHYHE